LRFVQAYRSRVVICISFFLTIAPHIDTHRHPTSYEVRTQSYCHHYICLQSYPSSFEGFIIVYHWFGIHLWAHTCTRLYGVLFLLLLIEFGLNLVMTIKSNVFLIFLFILYWDLILNSKPLSIIYPTRLLERI
jgi:hypothetical protein